MHHVAQKSSRMTLPLSSARLTFLPLISFNVNLRFAGLASTGHAAVEGVATSAASVGRPSARNGPTRALGHGRSALSVRNARATAPHAAIVHRMRMPYLIPLNGTPP